MFRLFVNQKWMAWHPSRARSRRTTQNSPFGKQLVGACWCPSFLQVCHSLGGHLSSCRMGSRVSAEFTLAPETQCLESATFSVHEKVTYSVCIRTVKKLLKLEALQDFPLYFLHHCSGTAMSTSVCSAVFHVGLLIPGAMGTLFSPSTHPSTSRIWTGRGLGRGCA